MIGLIQGTLTEINGSRALIITSGGVGYSVFITSRLIQGKTLPFEITLRTYLHVKEDSLTLYGFENYEESLLFSYLLTVDGIGPKTAYTIISHAPSNQTIEAIRTQDLLYFTSISGLGKKTAQKLLLELSTKVGGSFELQSIILSNDDKTVIDALQSLGFSRSEANKIIPELDHTKSIEEQIKEAIRKLTKI
jgi:Holliday junction DNA helicase RuvA